MGPGCFFLIQYKLRISSMPLVKKHLDVFPWVSVECLLCAIQYSGRRGWRRKTQEATIPSFEELTVNTQEGKQIVCQTGKA